MKSLDQRSGIRNKVILLLLAILLVLCYIQFVDRPLKAEKSLVQNKIMEAEEDRDFAETRAMNLASMKERLDELKGLDGLSYMPSYNASEEELDILNDVLSGAKHYDISFSDVLRSGDQVRRNFTINFTVSQYKDAVNILSKLNASRDRCMVSSVSCSSNYGEARSTETIQIQVSAMATFYETMEGGREDSGLTEDDSMQSDTQDQAADTE